MKRRRGFGKVSVVIPVFNEERTIERVVEAVIKASVLGLKKEIIVVNDGSRDGTEEVLTRLKKKHNNLRVFKKKNGGKGSALRLGIKKATGSIIIPQDADLELGPTSYAKLIRPIVDGETEVVFGYRSWWRTAIPVHSKAANLMVTLLANWLYGADIKDEACGYKVMTTSLYKSLNLQSDGFEICPETLAKLRKLGYSIRSVPIRFTPRKFNEGKKINFHDGFNAIWSLIKFRFEI